MKERANILPSAQPSQRKRAFLIIFHRTTATNSKPRTAYREEQVRAVSIASAVTLAQAWCAEKNHVSRGQVQWRVCSVRDARVVIRKFPSESDRQREKTKLGRGVSYSKLYRATYQRFSRDSTGLFSRPISPHIRNVIAPCRQQALRMARAIAVQHNAENPKFQWTYFGLVEAHIDLTRPPIRVCDSW